MVPMPNLEDRETILDGAKDLKKKIESAPPSTKAPESEAGSLEVLSDPGSSKASASAVAAAPRFPQRPRLGAGRGGAGPAPAAPLPQAPASAAAGPAPAGTFYCCKCQQNVPNQLMKLRNNQKICHPCIQSYGNLQARWQTSRALRVWWQSLNAKEHSDNSLETTRRLMLLYTIKACRSVEDCENILTTMVFDMGDGVFLAPYFFNLKHRSLRFWKEQVEWYRTQNQSKSTNGTRRTIEDIMHIDISERVALDSNLKVRDSIPWTLFRRFGLAEGRSVEELAREFAQIVEDNRIHCIWDEEEKQWYVPDAARIVNSHGTVNRQGYATKRALRGSELSAEELQRSQAASQRLVEARNRVLRETQRHVPDAVDTPHCEAGVEDQPVPGTARDVLGGEIQRTVCGATPIQRPRSQLCYHKLGLWNLSVFSSCMNSARARLSKHRWKVVVICFQCCVLPNSAPVLPLKTNMAQNIPGMGKCICVVYF